MKRLLICLASLWLSCFAAVSITSIADVSGDAAAHAVASSGSARWIQFIAPTTNTSVVRVGDSAVTATRGAPIAPGGGLMLPPIVGSGVSGEQYSLGAVFYLAQSGDKITIIYGK